MAMQAAFSDRFSIRELDPGSEAEIALVARRMRQTLEEVLGEEKGKEYYSMEWLVDRVRWHLDPAQTEAKIFLCVSNTGEVVGQAIARLEQKTGGEPYGYFSTIFVEPGSRSQGLATSLLLHVEGWLRSQGVPKIIYNTARNHEKLIRLFGSHGFAITHREAEMVQLTKTL
jgi:GNAT superfamily N-acetyltransferase